MKNISLLFNKIKKFFFKKIPSEEKIEIVKEELDVSSTQPLIKKSPDLVSKPKEKSELNKMLDYIEDNREKISEEKDKNKLKILEGQNSNEIGIQFDGTLFLIDRDDLGFFNDEFNQNPYVLIVHKIINKSGKVDCYLARDSESLRTPQFFHRMIMEKEIGDFCLSHNCNPEEVVVHHKGFNPVINLKNNLQVMTKKEHDELHHRI